jgi:hypothetical protein
MGRFRHSASHKNLPNWVRNCIGRLPSFGRGTQPEVFDQFAVDAGHGVDIVAKCDSSAVDQVGVEPVMGFDQCVARIADEEIEVAAYRLDQPPNPWIAVPLAGYIT